MKRLLCLAVIFVFVICCFSGCGTAQQSGDSLRVVTTIFPIYDWTSVISDGTDISLSMLMDGGVDMHSYQATAADIMKVASCDVLIYIGGVSDAWIEDAVRESENPDLIVLNLMDVLGEAALQEQTSEGMQGEEEEQPENDEHIWLSLKNAQILVQAIADALAQAAPEQADTYAANAAEYISQLAELDAAYTQMVAEAKRDTVVFGDRFPFLYMMNDYNISWYAAFPGCSAETEASFETVVYLADKVDELDLDAVLIIDGSDGSVADTIIRNTSDADRQVLTMHSLQSVTSRQARDGVTYLSLMRENLDVLAQALN